ncbi:MAG TPA: hypothetical protein VFC26_05705 [Verrucomicrobiae bacterium]|nr:hypothetical protein [Verrucomicrobiae bacterium]
MKTNLLIPGQFGHRAELETVHHRMMVRARHRARGGRWWWQQGRHVVRNENNGRRTT